MSEKLAGKNRKSLVIVESPAKARTIAKYLGRGFTVEASIGHVRDLPQGAKELPDKFRGEDWAYLGVNVHADFTPVYIIPSSKRQQVAKLRNALKQAKDLYLATDEDREGEAISWHLCEVLKPKVPVRRLVFHEITAEAIQDALSNPRDIDDGLVRAQETRRILDRLYGYEVSPLLWRKIGPRLSAGRVQSVAVRLIVDRERERMAFVGATYWDLLAVFAPAAAREFQAVLVAADGRRIPSGRDFDPKTGHLKDPSLLQLDERRAAELAQRLRSAVFRIAVLEDKPYTASPAPPFTTSTMQQEANRKLNLPSRRTMDLAQTLYENGYITYMRTDSTSLAQVAVDAARDLVRSEYGEQFLPDRPRVYASKVKNAQEAHEAIRPAGHPFRLPESLRSELSPEQFRLFELIWKRTVASQMADARGRRVTITIEGGGATFQVSGKTIEFAGFLRAYVEGSDDPDAELADKETTLPAVRRGQTVQLRDLAPKPHSTQPPARYSEASLTGTLEEMGIGRPSTYAAIIETILARQYVFKKGNSLVPTWVAFSVSKLLEEHLPSLIDYQFTAQMEDFLDAISRGEAGHIEYLRGFYFGDGDPGLKRRLEEKVKQIDARDVGRFLIGKPTRGRHREDIYVRVGKFGPFLEQGERRMSLPEDMPPDELALDKALELLERGRQEEEPLGVCPDTKKPVFLKQGRFGPYVQLGAGGENAKPKNASLLKGMTLADVNLQVALQLLSLPRTLGGHPDSGQPVTAHNGRFGPYVKCGDETRSLPADLSPLDITLDEATGLLSQPKTRTPVRSGAKEPLRVLGASPVTGEPVRLMEGRYGPYVTDGRTNASAPKGMRPQELTLDRAVDLLAARAARGGSGRRGKRKNAVAGKVEKPAAKKTASNKKAAPRNTAAKKARKR